MKTIETLDNDVFRHLIVTIGELPSSFVDSMSYYEMIAWLVDYLKKEVVPAINNNAEAVKEIQKWIENLDIQDEVDNKLEEMAESGELATIIAQLVDLGCVFAYKTIAEMAAAENLADGSVARVLGKTNYADGDGDYYVVREIRNTDVVDGYNIVTLTNTVDLVAERVESVLAKYYIIEEIEIEKGVDANGTEYYIAHIPHTDSKGNVIELKHGMSGDATTYAEIGLNENGLEYAHRYHTTFCSNASGFDPLDTSPYYNKPIGPIILNGVAICTNTIDTTRWTKTQILGIKRDNTLKAYAPTTLPSELLADGVYNSVVAFDQLLENGVRVGTETQTKYAWNLIGQNSATLDIYFFACNGGADIQGQEGMLLDDCVQILANKGCDFAYRLDQGGSTTFVYKGEMQNIPNDNYGQTIRKVGDFLYFNKPLLNKTDVAEAGLNAAVGDVKAKVDALDNRLTYLNNIDNNKLTFNYPNVRESSGDGGMKIYYKKNGSISSTLLFDRDDFHNQLAIYDSTNQKTVGVWDGTSGIFRAGADDNANRILINGSDGTVKVGARSYADVCDTLTRQTGSWSPDSATATSVYYVQYDAGQSPTNRPYTKPYVLQTFTITATFAVQIAIPVHADLISGTLKIKIREKLSGTWTAWADLN